MGCATRQILFIFGATSICVESYLEYYNIYIYIYIYNTVWNDANWNKLIDWLIKGHCQGQKGHVWLIFTHFSILIISIEVLPKCIASCSFSEVILVLFSNWFILKVIFKVRKVQFEHFFYLFRPISQKRCMLWPMFVWSTYTKSYMIFQLTLWSLTLDYL